MSLVSFVKLESQNQLRQAILNSLDLIHFNFPRNLENVVIKPNMCYYWDYSTGQTTDPRFVGALIDFIHNKTSPNVEISIVESNASAMKCKYAFTMLGYEKLAQDYNAKLINLSEDKSDTIEVMVGNQPFRLKVPKTIQQADLKINVPKIKYMSHTKISCALKNIFGCNPNPDKFKYHSKINEAIIALNKVMKFDLCILDGIIIVGNQTRKLDLIMASQDPVALDAAASKIAGINPKSVPHIMLAYKEGLGNITCIPKGENPKSFEKQFPKKGLKDKVLFSAYKLTTQMGLLDAEML